MRVKNNKLGKNILLLIMSILITFCLLNVSAGGVTNKEPEPLIEPPEGSIEKPDWQVGDRWSMGYERDFSDIAEEMKSELDIGNIEINKFDLNGKLGIYQSANVERENVDVTINGKSYKCYDVYFEQYVGMVYNMDYDFSVEVPDYEDEYYYEYEEYDESDGYDGYYGTRDSAYKSSETNTMRADCTAYWWTKSDVTGHIYYTEDELAVAKGNFDFKLDGEVDMDILMDMGSQGKMTMKMDYTFDDIRANYQITYDPPLDIFDFPIEPDEYWWAKSNETKTLTQLTGKVTYNANMVSPETPITNMDEDIDLAREVNTPDTYGPRRVTYYFENSGSENIKLTNGIDSECFIIEPDDNYWYRDYYEYDYYDDYWYDYDSDGYSNKEEYIGSELVSVPPIPGGSSEGFDFDAETVENPIETVTQSKNYFSEDEGNIVSYNPPETDSGTDMYGMPSTTPIDEESRILPKTYNEVTEFKSIERENMKNEYPRSSSSGSGKNNDDDNNLFLIIVSIVAFLVIIMIALVINISKKRRTKTQQPINWPQEPSLTQQTTPTMNTQRTYLSTPSTEYQPYPSQPSYYETNQSQYPTTAQTSSDYQHQYSGQSQAGYQGYEQDQYQYQHQNQNIYDNYDRGSNYNHYGQTSNTWNSSSAYDTYQPQEQGYQQKQQYQQQSSYDPNYSSHQNFQPQNTQEYDYNPNKFKRNQFY